MKEKESWIQPELIILLRGKPEEAVLLTCKVDHNTTGPLNINGTGDACGLFMVGQCEDLKAS